MPIIPDHNSSHDSDVTVVIPVRNGLPFLPLAVESVLSQTYQRFQLLVIDDGSTDGTHAWLQTLRDPRIRIISHPNKGLCRTLNEAITQVTTKYIARLDHDDLSFPYRLAEQRCFLEKNQHYAGVLGNSERIGENHMNFGPVLPYDPAHPICLYSARSFGCIPNSTLMIRTEIFRQMGGYREFMFPVDDYDFLLRLAEVASVAVLMRPVIQYRINSQGVTFKTYTVMQWKTRLALENARRRSTGESEIMPEEFLKMEENQALLTKFSTNLAMLGQLNFRKAGLQISNQKYCKGIFLLLLAGLANPLYVAKRLGIMMKSKAKNPSRQSA